MVPGDNGTITHSQLSYGSDMIMVGTDLESEYGKLVKIPKDIGQINTITIYMIVTEPESHYKRAINAGAQIVVPLKSEEYGGQSYTCRDLEGYLWTFGTYDPWFEGY